MAPSGGNCEYGKSSSSKASSTEIGARDLTQRLNIAIWQKRIVYLLELNKVAQGGIALELHETSQRLITKRIRRALSSKLVNV